MSINKTQEQGDIITTARTSSRLLINAVSGSGKTSTLAMVAEDLGLNTLLLVFNKEAQVDAASKFPANVETRTTHSMAYQAIGCNYQAKLTRPRGGYVNVAATGSEIAKYFGIKPMQGSGGKLLTSAYIGLLARDTLSNYESSADEVITKDHLVCLKDAKERYAVDMNKLSSKILEVAKKLWEERIDISSDVMITHDTYMKLWQLTKPQLSQYEVIMLDEAQDTTDCVLDIFKNQEKAKLIAVGDSRQAIYGWRGAVNAMKKLDWDIKPLTISFRYGQSVANLASKILRGVPIKSLDSISTEIGEVDRSSKYTILYRTNSNLVMDAVKEIRKGRSVKLEMDTSGFCRKLESCEALYIGDMRKVKHEDILAFTTWADLVVEAKKDPELSRIQGIIEADNVSYIIDCLNNHSNSSNALCTMTTAHKSKGREWDQVVLANDFPSNYKNRKWVGLSEGEENLLYVAATRGKVRLEPNETVEEFTYYRGYDSENPDIVRINMSSGGDMAALALEHVCIAEGLRGEYHEGMMTQEEAFEHGFIGPCGDETGYGDTCIEPLPLGYEELERALEIETLKFESYCK